MKNVKKILSLVVVLCLCLTFAACHKKNETAVKVGDLEFSSGYYACVFYFTDAEARQKVSEALTEAGESTDNIDYSKQKIEDKDYADWVKDETINKIKRIAVCKAYCQKNKLEIEEADANYSEQYVEYLWENNYSDNSKTENEHVYVKNGFSKDTLTTYFNDLSYESLYFDHVFGADGEKAVAEDKLKEELSTKYAIADMLDVDFTDLTEEQITEKTEQLNGYLEELKAGTRTFEEIYHEYNGSEHEDTQQNADAEEGSAPLDSHASFIGAADTDYSNDNYEEVKAMAVNEVKIVDKKDSSDKVTGKTLIVKKDILADPYYLKNYDSMLRHALADEDFDKMIDEDIEKLDFKEYTKATKVFTIKKIYVPDTSSAT